WLSPLNFRQTQSDIYGLRREGTSEWALNDPKFKDWQCGEVKTLWCPGIPGVGKTVLSSFIIDHLIKHHRSHDVAVLFIYCNYKEQAQQSVSHLVASLLKQLVQDFPPTFHRVQSQYESRQEQRLSPTLEDVHSTLLAEIKTFSQVFIVVDALDEIAKDDGSHLDLLTLLQSLGCNLLVTSRDMDSIGRALHDVHRMDIHAHDDDMRMYIEGCIRPGTSLHVHIAGDSTLREEIIGCVIAYAKGMFLLCCLFMESLAIKPTRGDVRTALKDLPKGVDTAYKETVKRICGLREGLREIALNAIMVITYAYRPLSIRGLQYILALIRGLEISDDDLVDEAIIVDACVGLVKVDAQDSVFRFFHCTVQEYFVGYQEWLYPNSHAKLTSICLKALSPPFLAGIQTQGWSGDLTNYAAQYWGHHARGDSEKTNKDAIYEFLNCEESVNMALNHAGDYSSKYGGGSTLHLCAFFGLAQTIVYQLENCAIGDHVNSKTRQGMTPLSVAAAEGQVEVVKVLLERNDVDINSKDERGWVPLMFAAQQGHEEIIVKLLLAREGVDVNSANKDGWTPLFCAAQCDHATIVELLLATPNIDVNFKDKEGVAPLSCAASNGQVDIVKLLLERHEVDADSVNEDGWTPLFRAAQNGHVDVMRLLLAKPKVNVNYQSQLGYTPLSIAALKGHGRTPISFAAQNGHVQATKLLLTRDDVDVNLVNNKGWAPLSFAAQNGHVGVVKVLLANPRVNLNSKTKMGGTPLSVAVQFGKGEVVKLLLARDTVQVNLVNNIGRTPLSFAAEYGHLDIVKLL
ncbi:hypothetical protein SERLA73DRAFT_30563, partial [Serpula lacrymans var. lacrymans S7.3]